jgi:hypothetical protein
LGAVALPIKVILIVLFGSIFITDIADEGCGCMEAHNFPTIEVSLIDTPEGDRLVIKQKSGDPLDFSEYSILITEKSNQENQAFMGELTGIVSAGEGIIFSSENAPGFDEVDYTPGTSYKLEIFDTEDNKHVWQHKNILCV